MKLVVGLGNPGRRYEATRHSVGFKIVECFAARWRIELGERCFGGRFGRGSVQRAEGEPLEVALLEPQTFMNRSGAAVAEALRGLAVEDPAADLLVVLDDVDLPFGRLRVRPSGGAGGHRGLEDVIETSLIIGLVVLIAIGAAEWGLGLKDWLSITAGTREGARVGAAAGDTSGADCVILEASAGAVRDINGEVLEVWIYESDISGPVGARQRYRPFVSGDDAAFLKCGTWFIMENSWPENLRDNDGATRDWLGVRVVFDHDWVTGFAWFSGSVCDRGTSGNCWSGDTVMHIEPDPNP